MSLCVRVRGSVWSWDSRSVTVCSSRVRLCARPVCVSRHPPVFLNRYNVIIPVSIYRYSTGTGKTTYRYTVLYSPFSTLAATNEGPYTKLFICRRDK